MAKQATTVPTSIVKKVASPSGAPAQAQVLYEMYDIVKVEDINGKPIDSRVLRATVSKEQLLSQKESYTQAIAKIDSDLAEIAKVK